MWRDVLSLPSFQHLHFSVWAMPGRALLYTAKPAIEAAFLFQETKIGNSLDQQVGHTYQPRRAFQGILSTKEELREWNERKSAIFSAPLELQFFWEIRNLFPASFVLIILYDSGTLFWETLPWDTPVQCSLSQGLLALSTEVPWR